MANILIIGAGRSSYSLIDYLKQNSSEFGWKITIADMDLELASEKAANHPNVKAIQFDSRDHEKRRVLILEHDVVISMLPASLHISIARDCVEFGKHLFTASYLSPEMKTLESEAKAKQILLLNECGLDPGLDHASAMKVIDTIKNNGGHIVSFRSYCGGLVAPESNDNPWGYKFSWNPRNVVLAGQGTAQYLEDCKIKFIPYNRLFLQTETVEVNGLGKFDAYANRDSIGYMDVYGLSDVKTMLRGTLRHFGFCKAWNVFVKLGLTDDTSSIIKADRLSYSELLSSFLTPGKETTKQRLKALMGTNWDEEIESMLDYLDLFSDRKIPINEGSPALLLQLLLEEKWKLQPDDKDMIVMRHEFEYQVAGEAGLKKQTSTLVVKGHDQQHTAMALTVGLPLAITVKNFLTGKFKLAGNQIPVLPEIYEPMLKELESHNISFEEETS
jgi:saccharopine dehydrogenase-like NADP-dependent oxidoreductase